MATQIFFLHEAIRATAVLCKAGVFDALSADDDELGVGHEGLRTLDICELPTWLDEKFLSKVCI